jgi:hypothetical protein
VSACRHVTSTVYRASIGEHGLTLEDGPDGWLACRMAIPRSRIRLVRADVPAPDPPA